MMLDLRKVAKQCIKMGFSVIPVTARKNPAIPSWVKYQKAPMSEEEVEQHFHKAEGIAVLCGGTSKLFCLDADMKYDLTGTLWERFKKAVPAALLKKLYCQKTKNGGYHLVCIVPESRLFGNEKFASRYTTAYERDETYRDAFANIKTRDNALKIGIDDKSRILFESRSGKPEACGGYFLIPPSPGYEKVYGKFQEITEDEYDILIETARSFNEVLIETRYNKEFENTSWELNPFDHYNAEADVCSVLENHGWTLVHDKNRYWRLRRPGNTPTKDSAIFDTETKILNVFTTSTSFDVGRGYSPTGVFIHLECEDDERLAYSKLINMGYGIPKN